MGKKGLLLYFIMLIVIVLAMLHLVSAYTIEGGEITVVRPNSQYIDFGYIPPEYLSIEDLVFYTCIQEEDTPVKSTVLCLDDVSFKDIDVAEWGASGNCFIGSYDIEDRECENLVIESEYIKNDEVIKISQPLKVNRFSSILDVILNDQYTDGGWRGAVDTAAGIWVLSNYSSIFADEIELAVDWLKEYRDDEFKCWPDDDCSVEQTAKILAFLTLANINDSKRIIHDGLVFLRKWQNYYQNDDDWNLSIRPFESGTTSCIISHDRSHLNNEEFNISSNETTSHTLSAYPDGRIILICDQNIYANLTTEDSDLVFVYEGDNLSFTTPYPGWPIDEKWGDSDLRTTEFALMTEIPDDNYDAGMGYLESWLRTGRIGEQYIESEENFVETALYTYLTDETDEDETTIAWMRYKQHNNGSWGTGNITDKIMPTAYSIMGLIESGFSRNNEVIEDAERWMSYEEYLLAGNKTADYEGWNTTELNALAFTVLKHNSRPLLKFSPIIIILDEATTEIELFNPTTFPLMDVKYEFSSEIDSLVEVTGKEEIPAYSYVKLKLARNTADTGEAFGYLIVKNANQEIAKTPVMIISYPTISITPKEDTLTVFGTKSRIEFNIDKTAHSFGCTLVWDDDDISSKSDFDVVSGSLSVDVSFSNAERVEKTYKGEFKCTTGVHEFTEPVSIDFSRYSTYPFSVEPDTIVVNSSGQHSIFTVTNKLDESLDVELKFAKSESMFKLGKTSLVIDPNDKANVTILNNVAPDLNLTKTNTIQVSALGETKTINFNAFISAKPAKKLSPIVLYLLLFILFSAIGVGGYYGYKNKDFLLSFIKKGSKVDKIKIKIRKLEEKEKKTAILNMVTILRMQNKDDKDIRKRLVEEGFSEKEIDEAFEQEVEKDVETEKEEESTEDTTSKSAD